MLSDHVTVSQAAAILGLTAQAVRLRLEKGVMQGVKVHRRLWLIPRTEVDRWRELGRMKSGPKPKARRAESKGERA